YSWGSSFPEILASLLLIARTNYFGFLCPCSIAGLCSLISLLAKSGYNTKAAFFAIGFSNFNIILPQADDASSLFSSCD
ncbi:MAG: hypothetical protein IJ240_03575, partial [Clostridia bacterium]|nr:hypothetical protein [Clostridia bacterium]